MIKKREAAWNCPTCAQAVVTPFCSGCGEGRLRPRDLTLHGVLAQVMQAVASIDGPLLRSLRCLLTRPGALTVAYLQGQRKPYTLPLQLFLLSNVLFFAMQSLTGGRVFATPLEMHLHDQFWSASAQNLVTHRLASTQRTLEAYTPVFNQAVELNAKSLVVLMTLPFALLTPLVFWRSHRPFVGHLVFALHLYTFLLLLFSLALLVVAFDVLLGGPGLHSEAFDHTLSIIEVAACVVYLYLAASAVFAGKRVLRALQTLLLVVAVVAIVLGYRFVLLPITLYTT